MGADRLGGISIIVNEWCLGLPSVRMGLQAINWTKRLAKVISQPHGKAGIYAAKPSSYFLNPGCRSHPVSVLMSPNDRTPWCPLL